MAISDYFSLDFLDSSSLLSSNSLAIGGSVMGIAALLILIYFVVRNRAAERGSRSEKSLEREVGLGRLAGIEQQIEKIEKSAAKKEADTGSAEKVQETKEKGGKAAAKSDESVEQSAEASEHEEKAEEATTAIEWRSMGIEAALKKIARAINEYVHNKRSTLLTEEQEGMILDEILSKIKNTRNYGVIDNRINERLREFLGDLVSNLRQDIASEEKKKEMGGNLVRELENAVNVMKSAIKGARIELKKFKSEERKTRKHFKKDIKDIKKALRTKLKELLKLSISKNSNPSVIASLKSEISLLRRRLKDIEEINRELEATYKFMKKEVREIKRLLKYVLANEKGMNKYAKLLEDRKSQIGKKLEELKSNVSSIEKVAEVFKLSNPHEVALALSERINLYFQAYIKILEEDLSFDNSVRDITIKNFVITQQMDAFQKLTTSLTQSEEAVGAGVSALTELVGSIVSQESKVNVVRVVKTLQGAMKILEYEKGVESFMSNLVQAIKNKSVQLNSQIVRIVEEDKKLIAQVNLEQARNSSHVGNVMATATQRKINIDETYISKAIEFKKQLKERNPAAAASYNKAVRLEQYAAAA